MRTLATCAIPLPTVFVRGTLEDRLSLHCSSVIRIKTVAFAHRAYHALVLEFHQHVEDVRAEEDYSDICVPFSQLVYSAWRHEELISLRDEN